MVLMRDALPGGDRAQYSLTLALAEGADDRDSESLAIDDRVRVVFETRDHLAVRSSSGVAVQ